MLEIIRDTPSPQSTFSKMVLLYISLRIQQIAFGMSLFLNPLHLYLSASITGEHFALANGEKYFNILSYPDLSTKKSELRALNMSEFEKYV